MGYNGRSRKSESGLRTERPEGKKPSGLSSAVRSGEKASAAGMNGKAQKTSPAKHITPLLLCAPPEISFGKYSVERIKSDGRDYFSSTTFTLWMNPGKPVTSHLMLL